MKPLGTADEATGLEDVVEPWVETIYSDMEKACAAKQGEVAASESAVAPSAETTETSKEESKENEAKEEAAADEVATPNADSPAVPMTAASSSAPAVAHSSTPLCVLYGSATGNSEHIAKDIAAKYKASLDASPSSCFFPEVICAELNQFKKKCQKLWEEEPVPEASRPLRWVKTPLPAALPQRRLVVQRLLLMRVQQPLVLEPEPPKRTRSFWVKRPRKSQPRT